MLQNDSLFGIPLIFIGLGCFILAAIFLVVWPKSIAKAYKQLSLSHYIVHYFQSLAWILLGMGAVFLPKSVVLGAVLAVLGIIAYIIFIVVTVRTKRPA